MRQSMARLMKKNLSTAKYSHERKEKKRKKSSDIDL